jgi:hypothetical protein
LLALLVSAFIVAYVIVPGVVFGAVFSSFVPLRAFDRTRTQELAYSVVVCVLPFLLALWLVQNTRLGWWPLQFADTWLQRDADYRAVLLACFGDKFAGSADELWSAAMRSCKRQGRLLFWYLTFVGVEALLLGFIASKWGKIQPMLAEHARTEQLLTRILLRNISEWHVLLTNFLFPGTTIHVDVLTSDDHLYQGDVLNYTRDREGKLTGIYLNNAERYNRARLLADRKMGKAKPTEQYWTPIPGSRLFIFADKLCTLNIRPQTTLAAAKVLALQLDPNATVTVSTVAEPHHPQGPPGPVQAEAAAESKSDQERPDNQGST